MVRNKNEFEQGSKELLNYELKLMQQILVIEQVQKQSDTVVSQCKSNIKELDAIQTNQNQMIDELDIIEKELDSHLLRYEHDTDIVKFQESGASFGLELDEVPLREQVYRNALQIDSDVTDLNRNVIEIQKEIDGMMKKNDHQAKSNAVMFSMKNGSNQNDVISATGDIQKILGTYYESLKWIQSAAIDLQFQTQEIEEKVSKFS